MFEDETGPATTPAPGAQSQGPRTGLILFAVTLLIFVPLAGCAGNGDSNGAPPSGEAFEASDQRSTAEVIAEDWSGDATLVGVATREMGQQPENWSQEEFTFTPDENIGDGRVPQWVYFFENDEGDTLGVGVNAAGETYSNPQAQPRSQGGEIVDWSVDSAAAVDAAKENQTFSSILEADDAAVLYFLSGPQQQGGAANWAVQAASETMDQEQTVLVNAETGETRTFQS